MLSTTCTCQLLALVILTPRAFPLLHHPLCTMECNDNRWDRFCQICMYPVLPFTFTAFSRHFCPKWLTVIHTNIHTLMPVATSTSGAVFGIHYLAQGHFDMQIREMNSIKAQKKDKKLMFVIIFFAGKGTWSGYGARPRGKGIVDQCCQPAGCELQHLEMYCAKPKSLQHTTAYPATTTASHTTTQLDTVRPLLLEYKSSFFSFGIGQDILKVILIFPRQQWLDLSGSKYRTMQLSVDWLGKRGTGLHSCKILDLIWKKTLEILVKPKMTQIILKQRETQSERSLRTVRKGQYPNCFSITEAVTMNN